MIEDFFPENPDEFVEFIRNLDDIDDIQYIQQLLDYLLDGYMKLGFGIEVQYDGSIESQANVALYNADTNYDNNYKAIITINKEKYLESLHNNKQSFNIKAKQILVHELIHPLTSNIVGNTKEELVKINARKEDLAFYDDIMCLYYAASDFLSPKWYGMTNPIEFISEIMANQEFQIALSGIPYINDISTYNKFVLVVKDYFARKFDVDISFTLLEKALQVTHNYTSFVFDNGRLIFYPYKTRQQPPAYSSQS